MDVGIAIFLALMAFGLGTLFGEKHKENYYEKQKEHKELETKNKIDELNQYIHHQKKNIEQLENKNRKLLISYKYKTTLEEADLILKKLEDQFLDNEFFNTDDEEQEKIYKKITKKRKKQKEEP